MKGYLEQKGTPTPDKPVEIKSKLIGKNLFETYEVNGKQYTDNIPKDTLICISKEEFIEYKQQKEEIERLNIKIKDLYKQLNEQINFKTKNANEIIRLNKALLDIKEYIEDLYDVRFTDKDKRKILDIVNKALGSDKE